MKHIFLIYLLSSVAHAQFVVPDFDQSMQKTQWNHVLTSSKNEEELGVSGAQLYTFFKALYQKNNPLVVQQGSQLKIPKIIHQIWIGKSLPEEFKKMAESWKLYHPDWEYRLWTQDDIPGLALYNQQFVQASRNPGEISDLMRYEILYRYGGVYLDVDFECLRALDPLHYTYDFYIGIQPLDSGLVQLGIGIIGSIAGHPILKACIENVRNGWNNKLLEQKATARTGPIHCTKTFYAVAGTTGLCDIALPASYLYPLSCKATEMKRIEWVLSGAFAVHHWAKSWLYPTFRKPEFQAIKNY